MFEGIKKASAPPFVEYEGLRLPPKSMRLGSMPEKSDETYVKYAGGSVKLLETFAGASRGSRILDIGSGPGRLLIGMQSRWAKVKRYCGIDVNPDAIDWAEKYLANGTNIEFLCLDILSARYNPNGRELSSGFKFPVAPDSFEIAALFSVFSHMRLAEIGFYLRDLQRVLSPAGKIFCTLFVEDGVSEEQENPPGYLAEWSGPLHCIRLNRESFENTAREHGWKQERFKYGAMASGQSIYVLAKQESACK